MLYNVEANPLVCGARLQSLRLLYVHVGQDIYRRLTSASKRTPAKSARAPLINYPRSAIIIDGDISAITVDSPFAFISSDL